MLPPACWTAGRLADSSPLAGTHASSVQLLPRDELAMQTRTERQLHVCLPMHVLAEDSAMQGPCDCAGTITLRLYRAPNGEWIKTHQGDRDAG